MISAIGHLTENSYIEKERKKTQKKERKIEKQGFFRVTAF